MRSLILAGISLLILSSCGGGGGSSGGSSGNQSTTLSNNTNNTILTSNVSGKVVDTNGTALAGVTITAYQTNNHTSAIQTTDANGNYSISGLSVGDYEIRAEKTGYGFYADASKGTGNIIESDYNGLYRMVISYPKLTGEKVKGANFTAMSGSDKIVELSQTGASVSYASGDDADLHKGVALPGTRLKDNQNGTITDTLTGLIWMKNAGCFSPSNWNEALAAASKVANGSCGLSDSSMAGDWRMPNINELESIVDISQTAPALPANHPFTNIGNIYWSSTTYRGVLSNAWALRLSDGRYMNDSIYNDKASSLNSLWVVKDGSNGAIKLQATGQYVSQQKGDDGELRKGVRLPSPRFGDNGDGTVTDYATGLIWLKKSDCITGNWQTALENIHSLANGQCELTDGSKAGDWRMPNRNEMVSMGDRVQGNQVQYFNHIFYTEDNKLDQPAILNNIISDVYYWTSTTNATDTSEAWTVFSCDFGIYNMTKNTSGYAMAVRDYRAK